MSTNKMLAVAFGAAASAFVLGTPVATMPSVTERPCAPMLDPPKDTGPAAPTGLRVIKSALLEFFEVPERVSGPYVSEAVTDPTYPYFDALTARADCYVSYTMRSETELDSVATFAVSEKKMPITYDAVQDAALAQMYAPVSTDSQQKRFPIEAGGRTMFITWDMRFDNNFAYGGDGYLGRHKTYQIGQTGDHWIAWKTDYQNAAHDRNGVAELFMSTQGQRWLGPGTTQGSQEILIPRLAQFFIQPNTWTRLMFYVEGVGDPVAYISAWAADEQHDPVRLYNRLAVIVPATGPDKLWLEYDSSMDTALNPQTMHSWNRNLVVLKDIALGDVQPLLQRPTR
jgi:hypothetical protein